MGRQRGNILDKTGNISDKTGDIKYKTGRRPHFETRPTRIPKSTMLSWSTSRPGGRSLETLVVTNQ